ncbi:MAG TPA: DOMON-like domain-containing protein [Holophaga sp.]|nr:DOMON-like domain-containing protein [Holophaga sp.]
MRDRPVPGNAESPAVAELSCHPDSRRPPVQALQARASFLDAHTLSLGFTLRGGLEALRLPGPEAPERTDGLWQHTCFEAFLAPEGGEGYCEVNLSPSTAWASYTFQRYREGHAPAQGLVPRLVVHRFPDRLEVHAILGLDGVPGLAGRMRMGLSAVLEQSDGALSYWAIRHPAGAPDFHHPEAFALVVAPAPEED